MSKAGIPAEAREVFGRLLTEPLRDPAHLRSLVVEYAERLQRACSEGASLDPADVLTARDLSIALLDSVDESTGEEERRLIQAGALYFVIEHDGETDLAKGGLDDDVRVLQNIARYTGREV
jgi:hypothetical protein